MRIEWRIEWRIEDGEGEEGRRWGKVVLCLFTCPRRRSLCIWFQLVGLGSADAIVARA
jgi:hypothetical protein